MTVRENADSLVDEVRVVGLEGVLLGSDWLQVRKVALDCLDTAAALRASDREAADNLRTIARMLSTASWKMAVRRVGFKGAPAVKMKLLAGLRGR